MKIVHIYPSVYRMHGATKWLLLFTTKLQEKGHDNTIICVSFTIPVPFWFKGTIKPLFHKYCPKAEFSGLKKILFTLYQLLSIFFIPVIIPSKKDVPVIVFHSELSLFSTILAKLFFKRSKFVYYCYQPPRELYDLVNLTKQRFGVWFTVLSPFLTIYKNFDKSFVRSMDHVLVWSDQYQDYARSIYGNMNFQNVPAGVDFSVFPLDQEIREKMDTFRSELKLEDKNVLLTNSALTKKKNIPVLLNLLKSLLNKGYSVHGLIIGEGPEEHYLRELIDKLQIHENVTLLGYVSQEDLPVYYHLCDILYYLEPNGAWTMSTIEAGAARKPVIVAPGGSMPSLVSHRNTGFILNNLESENELYDYTTFLLDNPKARKEMGEKNFAHSKQFSAEKSAEKFLELIKQNF